jgi:hypothetical protein
MARGWESKSIEAQQDEAARPALTPDQRVVAERRRTLELSRARAIDDLRRATAPPHRQMLEQALQAIDQQLAELSR